MPPRLLLLTLPLCLVLPAAAYDPLALPPGPPPRQLRLTVKDAARQREIPLRILLPAGAAPAPAVLFSHGLGGSAGGSAYLGEHWSRRGYATVYLQHPGSDEAVWKSAPPGSRRQALEAAASGPNLILRLGDVRAVLNQLEAWNRDPAHPLAGRLRMDQVGMSGHSFGALTTQGVSGQSFPVYGGRLTDPRIRAAVIMSPSAPRRGSAAGAFASVRIPWLLMTGTQDVASIGGATLESRLAVFPVLPAGGKYELVLDGAEHSAFTERAPRNPNHHRVILALATAFWDAWLRHDPAARVWLESPAPRALMEPADRWQSK